ncbi:Holliday junction resolvase RecU [Mycoplasma todarodis]|uniref:Holliday junction resolvase RecU n=1 Tax=Mycoplasma todarodis TaxID=1937191 RepID=A0A4R0XJ80_9MOLU|nr:Holliday junction resolvase RecU [Mycoplasma todarodis]TCG10474.1 Holliday junction resolvase RecU [Mycoplasma todarodis]
MKNRGMLLESILNTTINLYRKNNVALFHKKEIPISFGKVIKNGKNIRLDNAFIKSKSTSDYYGVFKGKFIAFEAKSTNQKSLPLSNIKHHQRKYLNDVQNHGGIAFYIFSFKTYDKYFMIYVDTIENLRKKSFSLDDANEHGIELDLVFPGILDFLAHL